MSYAADLSSYNAPADQIDWQQYIAWSKQGDGVSRLIIRACDGLVPDANWPYYLAAAVNNGIDEIIHYQFNNPDLNGPIVEADFLLGMVKPHLRPRDTLMADYEKSVPQADGVWALHWLQHVQTISGHLPAFYSYLSYIEERLSGATALAVYPLGLADYSSQQPPVPAPWTQMHWWQYSSSGSVPGIPGLVDVNQFFGGSPNMTFIPDGWLDSGTALSAPNGVILTGVFRDLLEKQPFWYGENVPLAPAYTASPLTIADPSEGNGLRIDFHYGESFGKRADGTVFFIPVSAEIAILKAQPPVQGEPLADAAKAALKAWLAS